MVISPAAYHGKTGLMHCCSITTPLKGYPFEVPIDGDRPSAGLADQIKSLDWVARDAQLKVKISVAELSEIRGKIIALVGKVA